jgi:hypothetical protein
VLRACLYAPLSSRGTKIPAMERREGLDLRQTSKRLHRRRHSTDAPTSRTRNGIRGSFPPSCRSHCRGCCGGGRSCIGCGRGCWVGLYCDDRGMRHELRIEYGGLRARHVVRPTHPCTGTANASLVTLSLHPPLLPSSPLLVVTATLC